MKKIIITLTLIFIVSVSFGFIILKKPAADKIQLEKVSEKPESTTTSRMIQEVNEDQW